jgi:hypothetical protein
MSVLGNAEVNMGEYMFDILISYYVDICPAGEMLGYTVVLFSSF